jgi:4-hydroxybenzoate polyprenyltransferase
MRSIPSGFVLIFLAGAVAALGLCLSLPVDPPKILAHWPWWVWLGLAGLLLLMATFYVAPLREKAKEEERKKWEAEIEKERKKWRQECERLIEANKPKP